MIQQQYSFKSGQTFVRDWLPSAVHPVRSSREWMESTYPSVSGTGHKIV
jgi:hypothetical protein